MIIKNKSLKKRFTDNFPIVSNLTFPNALIWMIILILSSSLCFYNLFDITIRYFDYDTIVSIHEEPPNSTQSPAITVCASNVFIPKDMAKLYPEFKRFYHEFLESKKNNPYLNATEIHRNQIIFELFESKAFEDFTAYDVIAHKSIQLRDLVVGCKFYPITVRDMFKSPDLKYDPLSIDPVDCDQLQVSLPSIYEGQKCFTFFSTLNYMKDQWKRYFPPTWAYEQLVYETCLNDSEPCHWMDRHQNGTWFRNDSNDEIFNLFYDMRPTIEILLKIDIETRNFLSDNDIKVTVHSPNAMINKHTFRCFHVTGSFVYEVLFTKQVSVLKHGPYKPKCSFYERHHKAGNVSLDDYTSLFHSYDECRNFCIKNYIFQNDSCLNYYNVLTLTDVFDNILLKEHICPHDQQNESLYLIAKDICEKQCPEECEQPLYEMTDIIEFSDDDDEVMDCSYNDASGGCIARVLINIAPQPFRSLNHRPAITYEELIGAIGGNLGVLLNMSIFSMISFAVRLIQKVLIKSIVRKPKAQC